MIDLKTIVAQIDALTPVPQAVSQVMQLADDPDSSLADVAEVIKYDPVITANMLKICNSAYFGLPRTIDSIHDATMLLGLDQIVELFILRCAFENLNGPQAGYDLKEGELLRQSASAAVVAKAVAEALQHPNKHMLFTAALLKDIGKVVMARYVADACDQIDALVQTQGLSFIAAEKRALGLDHAEIGGLIAKQWGFGTQLIDIIRHHHLVDSKTRDDRPTAIVYLADHICMLLGLCSGRDGMAYQFYDEILDRLQLTEATVNSIMMAYIADRPRIDAFIDPS